MNIPCRRRKVPLKVKMFLCLDHPEVAEVTDAITGDLIKVLSLPVRVLSKAFIQSAPVYLR